jgi:hypothetical protein
MHRGSHIFFIRSSNKSREKIHGREQIVGNQNIYFYLATTPKNKVFISIVLQVLRVSYKFLRILPLAL